MTNFSVLNITPGSPAFLVVSATYPPQQVLLYNTDANNVIWLGDNDAFTAGDINHCTPLNPLSSVTFDGSENVYAITSTGQFAFLNIYPTGAAFYGIVGVQPIFQGGTFNGTPITTIAPGVPYQPIQLMNVAQYTSYDVNMYGICLNGGAVGNVITALCQLQWFDDTTSGVPVFEEDWWFYAGRSVLASGTANNPLAGSGPMHGRYLTVTISIPATALFGMTLQYFNMFGSNRNMPYSDWRQNAVLVNPETNGLSILPSVATATAFNNTLVNIQGAVLLANVQSWVPCGLYSGPCYFYFSTGAAAAQTIVLISCEGLTAGQIVPGSGCPNVLWALTGNAQQGLLNLPRSPCAWVIHNNATTQTNANIFMVAQQAA